MRPIREELSNLQGKRDSKPPQNCQKFTIKSIDLYLCRSKKRGTDLLFILFSQSFISFQLLQIFFKAVASFLVLGFQLLIQPGVSIHCLCFLCFVPTTQILCNSFVEVNTAQWATLQQTCPKPVPKVALWKGLVLPATEIISWHSIFPKAKQSFLCFTRYLMHVLVVSYTALIYGKQFGIIQHELIFLRTTHLQAASSHTRPVFVRLVLLCDLVRIRKHKICRKPWHAAESGSHHRPTKLVSPSFLH